MHKLEQFFINNFIIEDFLFILFLINFCKRKRVLVSGGLNMQKGKIEIIILVVRLCKLQVWILWKRMILGKYKLSFLSDKSMKNELLGIQQALFEK